MLSRVRLSDPVDHSLPGSSVHGIVQARVLEWGPIAFSGLYQYQYVIISIVLCLISSYVLPAVIK